MIHKNLRLIWVLLALVVSSTSVSAQTLRVAVAANAAGLIKKLQADFKKQSGIEIEVITGASGKLTMQIKNGAPYDLFLSADTAFPDQLFAAGFGLEKPKIYALGSLILCGQNMGNLKKWQQLIASESIKKVAIANPKTAPYGKAAAEALKYYHLESKVNSKLVFGESISQVNTYVQTGVVNLVFTTESFLYENNDQSKLKWIRVDQKSYPEIAQAVILLTHAKDKKAAASRFYRYLSSASARKIIAANGYHLSKI